MINQHRNDELRSALDANANAVHVAGTEQQRNAELQEECNALSIENAQLRSDIQSLETQASFIAHEMFKIQIQI